MTAEISDERVAELRRQAVERWDAKPWYTGEGPLGSPGFVLRTKEVLEIIARIEGDKGRLHRLRDAVRDFLAADARTPMPVLAEMERRARAALQPDEPQS